MKKLIVAATALLLSTSAFAQFGVIGGLTSSSSDIKSAYTDLSSKNINQFHAGLTYKIGLGKIMAIQPALTYNVKGTTLNSVESVSDLNLDMKTGFLELPVQIQAGISLANIARIYGIAEPFIGYAITNEIKWEDLKNTDWDNVKDRFEYGIGLGAGVELFKHVQVAVRYFWNFGSLYGQEITFGKITKTVTESKCSGITLSAAILF